jgi:hypothetical protein
LIATPAITEADLVLWTAPGHRLALTSGTLIVRRGHRAPLIACLRAGSGVPQVDAAGIDHNADAGQKLGGRLRVQAAPVTQTQDDPVAGGPLRAT